MFGWSPWLPTDFIMPTAIEIPTSLSDYMKCRKQMKEAYCLALQHSNDRKSKDGPKNDTKKTYLTSLESGDRVLIKNLFKCGGTREVRNYWNKKYMLLFQLWEKMQ